MMKIKRLMIRRQAAGPEQTDASRKRLLLTRAPTWQ